MTGRYCIVKQLAKRSTRKRVKEASEGGNGQDWQKLHTLIPSGVRLCRIMFAMCIANVAPVNYALQ